MSSLLVFGCEKTMYYRDVQSDYLKFLHYSQMGIDYTSIAWDVATVWPCVEVMNHRGNVIYKVKSKARPMENIHSWINSMVLICRCLEVTISTSCWRLLMPGSLPIFVQGFTHVVCCQSINVKVQWCIFNVACSWSFDLAYLY
jgi:hypothetical protein